MDKRRVGIVTGSHTEGTVANMDTKAFRQRKEGRLDGRLDGKVRQNAHVWI